MALIHKAVHGNIPGEDIRHCPGTLRQGHGLEPTNSNRDDSARMHVKSSNQPGLAELAGLKRALLHDTVHRDKEHLARHSS